MIPIRFAYSPCPNDTYLFYALAHQIFDTDPFSIQIEHHAIDQLNALAQQQAVDATKVSLLAYGSVREHYSLLSCGAALGKGYGPVVVVHPEADKNPNNWKLGLPGPHTTAHLLSRLWQPSLEEVLFLPFNEILTRLKARQLDAGVIIHESRFTYNQHGLLLHTDLGAWWQETHDLPLPLGVICMARRFTPEQREAMNALLLTSLDYAQSHPEEPLDYLKAHAQETDESALLQHIGLYVNEYTEELGEDGQEAIRYLLQQAENLGLAPTSNQPLFS